MGLPGGPQSRCPREEEEEQRELLGAPSRPAGFPLKPAAPPAALSILCLQPAPAQQHFAMSGCCSEHHKVLNGAAQTPRAENQPCSAPGSRAGTAGCQRESPAVPRTVHHCCQTRRNKDAGELETKPQAELAGSPQAQQMKTPPQFPWTPAKQLLFTPVPTLQHLDAFGFHVPNSAPTIPAGSLCFPWLFLFIL